MTPRQYQIYMLLLDLKDTDGNALVNIHNDLKYTLSPESINPAIDDLNNLKTLEKIQDFERVSSRVFKIINIYGNQ